MKRIDHSGGLGLRVSTLIFQMTGVSRRSNNIASNGGTLLEE